MNELRQKINKLSVSWVGRFIYRFLPYRRKLIKKNINYVFKDSLSETEKNHLIKAFYSHLLTSIKETIQLRFMSLDNLKARVEVRGHLPLIAAAEQGKGLLILTGHFGSWEFAPLGGILNFTAYQGKFHFIRRTLGNKTIERLLFNRYYQAGLQVIPKKNSLYKVYDALEKNHAVVFVLDQHASLANRDGIAVEFFGKKAGTYRSLASIARHTGLPVFPAASYRLPNGRHVLEFYPPLYWQAYDSLQDALYYNTLAYNYALERMILAHPEQWLWLHNRWKLKD